MVCFSLEFENKKIGEMVYKITEKEDGVEFVPMVGDNLKETLSLSNEDFEEMKQEDNEFMVYTKLPDSWLKDTLKELQDY